MEQYLEHIPYFLAAVVLGIIPNLLSLKRKLSKINVNISIWRYIEETFSALWISAVLAALLDEFTGLSAIAVYAFASLVAYFHSVLIDKIGNDIIVHLFVQIKEWLTRKFKK